MQGAYFSLFLQNIVRMHILTAHLFYIMQRTWICLLQLIYFCKTTIHTYIQITNEKNRIADYVIRVTDE